MTLILSLLMGSLVGLSLGVLGSGGSVLAVPILVYVLGIETKSAVAMSLVIVGFTALTGAVTQWRLHCICIKAALFFAGVGIFSALFGTWVAMKISGTLQLVIFGCVMVIAAIAMLKKKDLDPEEGRDQCEMRIDLAGGLGAGVGFLTGLLGVGGGFLIVPTLNSLGGLKLRLAIGTSLFIITINCAAGVVGYLGRVPFDWPVVAAFVVVSSLSSLVGIRLARNLPVRFLRKGFAIFVLVLGAGLVLKNALAL